MDIKNIWSANDIPTPSATRAFIEDRVKKNQQRKILEFQITMKEKASEALYFRVRDQKETVDAWAAIYLHHWIDAGWAVQLKDEPDSSISTVIVEPIELGVQK